MTINAETTINEEDELFIKSIVEETADKNNENTARDRQQLVVSWSLAGGLV